MYTHTHSYFLVFLLLNISPYIYILQSVYIKTMRISLCFVCRVKNLVQRKIQGSIFINIVSGLQMYGFLLYL